MFKMFEINNFKVKIEIADTFLKRLRGLIFKNRCENPLLLAPCNSIHMLFMKFPIDVAFIDRHFRVIKVYKNLRPWFGFAICLRAYSVIEFSAGTARRLNLKTGDKFHPIDSNDL